MPCPQPLPVKPPAPIAIFDWMMFQPLPSGSDSGLRKVRMRSFWYGRSIQNHATGAAAAMPPNAAANHHHDSPARNSTNAPLMPTSMAVPKSGCSRIRPVGTPMIDAATSTTRKRGGSGSRLRYHAAIIGSVSFSSSAGWK